MSESTNAPHGVARLIVTLSSEVSPWTISHFVQATASNYLKMTTIYLMAERVAHEQTPTTFLLSRRSKELYPIATEPSLVLFSQTVIEASTDAALRESPYILRPYQDDDIQAAFWEKFRRIERPDVVSQSRNGLITQVYEGSPECVLSFIDLRTERLLASVRGQLVQP